MNEVLALGPGHTSIQDLYHDVAFPLGKNGRPYVAINVVSSVDGKATIGGRAGKVGSDLDHMLMRRIRAAVDMVLIGAGTLRTENVDFRLPPDLQQKRAAAGVTPALTAAVLSASGDLPLDRTFFQSREFQAVVFVPRSAPRQRVQRLEKHVRVLTVGEKAVDLGRLMRVLSQDLGVKRLLVEGGPRVVHAFISAGLADELFLTISPKVVAGEEVTIVEGPRPPGDGVSMLQLLSAFAYRGELFLRYHFLPKE